MIPKSVSLKSYSWECHVAQKATFDISIFKHGSKAFGSKLQVFQVSFVSQFPKETWIERKHQIIEVWPESLGAMLKYWYIKRGLLYHNMLNIWSTFKFWTAKSSWTDLLFECINYTHSYETLTWTPLQIVMPRLPLQLLD